MVRLAVERTLVMYTLLEHRKLANRSAHISLQLIASCDRLCRGEHGNGESLCCKSKQCGAVRCANAQNNALRSIAAVRINKRTRQKKKETISSVNYV
jgi:hypothetical protein